MNRLDQLLGWSACGNFSIGPNIASVGVGACLWDAPGGSDFYAKGVGGGVGAAIFPIDASSHAVNTVKMPGWIKALARPIINHLLSKKRQCEGFCR